MHDKDKGMERIFQKVSTERKDIILLAICTESCCRKRIGPLTWILAMNIPEYSYSYEYEHFICDAW